MTSLISFEPAPDDYPNHLANPQPERLQLPSSRWLLVLLVVLCMAPRAISALRIPCICIDGPVFVNSARALEAGDFRSASLEGALNLYPAILAGLHRLGLEWEIAAALWGIVISSLVVLPLWGWVRRQFDDRVALAACLLYIVHPKFIIESPDVIRDATFWFFFTAAIYCLWRAVTEVRHLFFFTAGALILLATLTRVEGLLLLIPLALWTFWRWSALETERGKLLLGATVCVAAFPLLIASINAVVFYEHFGWSTVRLRPLARAQAWLEAMLGRDTTGVNERVESTKSIGRMLWVFFPTITRGLAPLYALMMFGGLWGWRRTWFRRDHQPLFYATLVLMCGIWVQLWCDNNISRRYALPIVLMACPFAALGLFALINRLRQVIRWLGGQARVQRLATVVALTIVLASGVIHAMTGNYDARRVTADIGRWVQHEYPTRATVLGPNLMTRIVTYYAENSSYYTFAPEANDDLIILMVKQSKPDVVILWPTKKMPLDRCQSLAERLNSRGFVPVSPADVTETDETFQLLACVRPTDVARKSTREQ